MARPKYAEKVWRKIVSPASIACEKNQNDGGFTTNIIPNIKNCKKNTYPKIFSSNDFIADKKHNFNQSHYNHL